MDNFWGTLPDWLVGLGTLALAGLTFWSLRRVVAQEKQAQADKKELQHQLNMQTLDNISRQVEESERAALQRRRAQAEQIVAWTGIPEDGTRALWDREYAAMGGHEYAAWVRNDSSLPITNVNLSWCTPNGGAPVETRNVPTVPPRSDVVIARPISLQANGEMPVEFIFTDAHGVVWRRTQAGHVIELGETNAATGG